MVCLLLWTASLTLARPAGAQDITPQEHVRVFLDCGACDFDYLRREVDFVDYVHDRKDADVHILVTTQGTSTRTGRCDPLPASSTACSRSACRRPRN